jgi:lysine 2,3-aminomutase
MPAPDWNPTERYRAESFRQEAWELLRDLDQAQDLDAARRCLVQRVDALGFELGGAVDTISDHQRSVCRDAMRSLRSLLLPRSASLSGFDLTQALWDTARGVARPDLEPGFWAELIHLVRGLMGRAELQLFDAGGSFTALSGREAAVARSVELDAMWARVSARMARFEDGLANASRARRVARRQAVLAALGGRAVDWQDWAWQRAHVITDSQTLARAVRLAPEQAALVDRARAGRLPFAITPYYASLLDDDWEAGRDRALRAQVLPPTSYVDGMRAARDEGGHTLDFMREADTSPVDLITRRYPAIAILKPYNTCPQICVYCQRNWEIEEALACDALASPAQLEAALAWLAAHPSIQEVLVTGGDPLAMDTEPLGDLLRRLAAIPHIDLIRIGSRTPVTMPMRIDEPLAALLGGLRDPGRREVVLVTHFEHVYEITPDATLAVERLRRQGIGVYNQHVMHFHVSRRFETAALRMLLRRIGVDPYYTFVPKGKTELSDYRLPVARVLQERMEEARLLPGMRRTDEAVFNVPRLGKNHVRAMQNRDLVAVLPDGARAYEFHPWEKHIADRDTYVSMDPPILEYLERLAGLGEDPEDYRSIWYYY